MLLRKRFSIDKVLNVIFADEDSEEELQSEDNTDWSGDERGEENGELVTILADENCEVQENTTSGEDMIDRGYLGNCENVNDDFSLPVDDGNDLAMVHGSVPRLTVITRGIPNRSLSSRGAYVNVNDDMVTWMLFYILVFRHYVRNSRTYIYVLYMSYGHSLQFSLVTGNHLFKKSSGTQRVN